MINAKEVAELSDSCFMKNLEVEFNKTLPKLEESIKALCNEGKRSLVFRTDRYSKPYLENLGYEVNDNGSIYW